jgi:hypothetical protein
MSSSNVRKSAINRQKDVVVEERILFAPILFVAPEDFTALAPGFPTFESRGPFITSYRGANLAPRGEFCTLGVKLSHGGEILCSPLHSSKQ